MLNRPTMNQNPNNQPERGCAETLNSAGNALMACGCLVPLLAIVVLAILAALGIIH